MSGSSGMDFLKEIKKDGFTTPFILLTGNVDNIIESEAYANGADGVLEKSIAFKNHQILVESIQKHLEQNMISTIAS